MFNIKLKELRKEYGYTQQKLAEMSGYTQGQIAHWEKGRNEPTESAIIKFAKIFQVSADYLLGLEDETGTKIHVSTYVSIPKK